MSSSASLAAPRSLAPLFDGLNYFRVLPPLVLGITRSCGSVKLVVDRSRRKSIFYREHCLALSSLSLSHTQQQLLLARVSSRGEPDTVPLAPGDFPLTFSRGRLASRLSSRAAGNFAGNSTFSFGAIASCCFEFSVGGLLRCRWKGDWDEGGRVNSERKREGEGREGRRERERVREREGKKTSRTLATRDSGASRRNATRPAERSSCD